MNCCVWADPSEGISREGTLVLVEITLEYSAFVSTQIVLWCDLRAAYRCVLSDVFWERFLYRPISVFSVNSPGLFGRSYKAICSLLLPVLDLEACGGGFAVN